MSHQARSRSPAKKNPAPNITQQDAVQYPRLSSHQSTQGLENPEENEDFYEQREFQDASEEAAERGNLKDEVMEAMKAAIKEAMSLERDVTSQLIANALGKVTELMDQGRSRTTPASLISRIHDRVIPSIERGRETLSPAFAPPPHSPRGQDACHTPQPAREIVHKHHRTERVPDPALFSGLTDDEDKKVSFENWEQEIRGKLKVNADHYTTEEARMYYVNNRTSGKPREFLSVRYGQDATEPFESAEEMLEYLGTIYKDHHAIQRARNKYQLLSMSCNPDNDRKPFASFQEFQTHYLLLANKAHIAKDLRFDDFFQKLNLRLRTQYTPLLPIFEGSLNKMIRYMTTSAVEVERLYGPDYLSKTSRYTPGSGDQQKTAAFTPTSLTQPTRTSNTFYLKAKAPQKAILPAVSTVPKEVAPETRKCFNCGQVGHLVSACKELTRKELTMKELHAEFRRMEGLPELTDDMEDRVIEEIEGDYGVESGKDEA
jgi:hypothetical protein